LGSGVSSLEIPFAHIASVRADPEAARGWYLSDLPRWLLAHLQFFCN
jgi:hypothetical protein